MKEKRGVRLDTTILYEEVVFMKKLKSLLVVTTLLMVLGFVLPAAGPNPDEGITVASNGPPIDSLGLF